MRLTDGQVTVAAFWLGALVYTFGPTVWRRLVAWWRPEPLAPYRWPVDQETHR